MFIFTHYFLVLLSYCDSPLLGDGTTPLMLSLGLLTVSFQVKWISMVFGLLHFHFVDIFLRQLLQAHSVVKLLTACTFLDFNWRICNDCSHGEGEIFKLIAVYIFFVLWFRMPQNIATV